MWVSWQLWSERPRLGVRRGTSLDSAMSEIRITLGRWLALALELALAADILRTVMIPTWDEIGKLGAIVVLRTVLTIFLSGRLNRSRRRQSMSSNPLLDFSWWGLALQLASAVVITGFVAVALVSLSLGRGVIRARLLVAEGVIGGLGVMTAATLLRTIGLRTWRQILMFTLILFLRILLKKLFVWEKQRLFQDPA